MFSENTYIRKPWSAWNFVTWHRTYVCSTLKYVKCHEFPDSESVTVQLFILKRSNHILQAHYSVVILS